MTNAVRRPTNVTISQTLLDEAKGLGLNISRAAETGIDHPHVAVAGLPHGP